MSGGFWLAVSVVLPVMFLTLSYLLWNWLSDSQSGLWTEANVVAFYSWLNASESPSTTIRNVGFVIAGLIALPLTIWRSLVADRQASAARDQADSALRQADTAQRGLLNERYQRGAEMLGSDVLSARLRGIYALARLAKEHPEEYHIQIMELLCAFARYPTEDANFPEQPEDANKFVLREDVQAAMRVVGARGKRHLRLAGKGAYHIDLHGADLRGGELRGLDLSSPSPDMIRSMPVGQAMSNAGLRTDLSGARLHGADFLFSTISGVDFSRNGESPATGLTVSQLLGAQWDDANPPTLKGLVDILTGKPLVLPKQSSHKNQS